MLRPQSLASCLSLTSILGIQRIYCPCCSCLPHQVPNAGSVTAEAFCVGTVTSRSSFITIRFGPMDPNDADLKFLCEWGL